VFARKLNKIDEMSHKYSTLELVHSVQYSQYRLCLLKIVTFYSTVYQSLKNLVFLIMIDTLIEVSFCFYGMLLRLKPAHLKTFDIL